MKPLVYLKRKGSKMSNCIYFRKDNCITKSRCANKIKRDDGSLGCARGGDLSKLNIVSEEFKAIPKK